MIKNTVQSIIFMFFLLYSCFSFAGTNPYLNGIFFQIYGSHNALSVNDWEQKFQDMKNVGMDTAIIQFVARDNICYYNSSLGFISQEYTNILPNFLTAADNQGISVIVPAYYDSDWFSQGKNSSFLATNLIRNSNIIGEMVTNFNLTNYSSFYGWYIPYEIDNYMFTLPADENKLINFMNGIADYCKQMTPGKIVTGAPFFNTNASCWGPDEFESHWKNFFNGIPNLDVMILQDCIGAEHAGFIDMGPYFNAARNACLAYNRELWTDLEIFSNSHASDISTVKTQLLIERPYTEKIISFEYLSYMDKNGTPDAQQFYSNYSKYYDSPCSDTNAPEIIIKETPYNSDGKKIKITFNEKINPVIAMDKACYKLLPYNVYPDSIEVDHANMRYVILSFPVVIGADYSLEMRYIEDLYENKIKISEAGSSLQEGHALSSGVFPNPCYLNKEEELLFYIKTPGKEIIIYNFYGDMINKIISDNKGKGIWNLKDKSGHRVFKGIYFYIIPDLQDKGKFIILE